MTLMRRAIDSLRKANEGERLPVPRGRSALGGLFGQQGGASELAQMGLYGSVSWLYAVVSRIAQATAASDWELFKRDRANELIKVESHPLIDLWERPNPFYSRFEFLEAVQQHIDLTGHSFWLVLRGPSGDIRELWPIRPDLIKPVPNTEEFIAGYMYTVGSERIPLQRDQVVWIRMPSPLSLYGATGPVSALFDDLESDKLSAKWSRNFFTNSAIPGGVLQFD